jgi:hypothetical protein
MRSGDIARSHTVSKATRTVCALDHRRQYRASSVGQRHRCVGSSSYLAKRTARRHCEAPYSEFP